jgi:hypothetical protein
MLVTSTTGLWTLRRTSAPLPASPSMAARNKVLVDFDPNRTFVARDDQVGCQGTDRKNLASAAKSLAGNVKFVRGEFEQCLGV